jgi:hypothetical protein
VSVSECVRTLFASSLQVSLPCISSIVKSKKRRRESEWRMIRNNDVEEAKKKDGWMKERKRKKERTLQKGNSRQE